MLQHQSDVLNKNDLFVHHRCLIPDEIGNGAICTCAGFSFALIWTKKFMFVFDSHSLISQGSSRSIKALDLFMMKYCEQIYITHLPYNMIFST